MSKEDDDQEGAGNLGVGRYPCMPSLVALQQMKNRLHLANLGKKLMKWTALATGKEIRRVAADLVLEYEDFASDIANCYILLARSRYYYPNLNKMVIEDIQNEATITVSSTVKSISAGVRGYMYEISESEKPSYPYLGIDRGGQIILETKIAWANLLKKMIMILQHRNTYEALEYANKAATKKQNVLGKLVIPKLVKSMKYILSEIEELAREDNFRLKTFKKSKLKLMAAKGKAVICSCCQNIFELGILKEIDNENLTCPNCAKGNAVSAKVMVCDNVGDKVMKYLEEHKDEIKEWANAAESVLNKPCCNIKELPNALPGVCLPETLDVSFMNKVEEIPEPTKELPPVETEPLPEIEELPELCHTCSFKPPSVCIVKPESCTKPVPCTKSEICTESKPCGMPDPCKGKLKVNASTEPDQTSCVACKASTLDDKPCVACLKEKQYLEDLLGSCIPCIINQKTSPYDGHKNIKFPVNQEGQTATGASTPCSISSRMASASSRMSSKLGMSDNSDIVEKTNLLETSPQSSPDTSGATTPKSSEVKEKDKQTGFETNESETRTCLCQGSEIQEDEKKGNRKPVEPTLYRRVRENDPTVYKHSTETEPDIKPITTAKQCGIMIRERSNHGQDLDKQTKKFCATSSEVESSSKLCREKTPICSYKSCKERIGVVDPDLKVVVQEMCCKESATNNITREFGTPLSSHVTCVNRAPKTEEKTTVSPVVSCHFDGNARRQKRSDDDTLHA
ncbi:hypothetical protein O0L34_g13473 [Tuta absoluta]|nr:hypothetical protein O0L34_g13473 [Tuta absoluta]